MTLVRWKRFTWNLHTLPPPGSKLPGYLQVRPASRDEEKGVTHVVFTAFTLDSMWSDSLKTFRDRLEAGLHQSFAREEVPALVVAHGPRIIAASVLSSEADTESHLLSGPCVLPEYCNRGIGSTLLHLSLIQLRDAGLSTARAITKENVPAAKFVYPKYGSTTATHDLEPLLAGP